MGIHRTARAGLVAALLGTALAACGTTVPLSQQANLGGDGLSPAASGAPAMSTPGAAGGGLAPAPDTAAPAGGGGPVVPAAGGLPTTVPTLPGSPGRSLPPIEIGTYYLSGGTEAVAAAGASGLVIPDNKPLFDAMVKYLNGHGGLGGRRIVPVEFKYVSGGDPSTQDQAACATFTQDHHVYLVVGGISSGAGQLGPCLASHGVPLIGANQGGDARYFAAKHRYVYEPGQVNFTLGLSTLVGDLASQGFFDAGARVGLVQYQGAVYDHAVEDGLVPALRRLGLNLVDRVSMQGTDNSTIAAGTANAVLKFNQADHINRVVFMAPGGAAAAFFMNAASSQQYHPRYGIWSADSPLVVALVAPKDQLRNAMGIGYQPGLDVSSSADPTATTPVAKKCLAFWDSLGQTDRSGLNNPLKRAMCDGFTTLLRAVAHSPNTLTSTAALEAGYDAIGTSYQPAATFLMRFAPGGHDAANGYRRLGYDTSCSCFVYSGATRRLR